jgi:hypothetical protein
MGGHMTADIGATALGSMEDIHTFLNAIKSIGGSHRHAHFTGINI